MLEVSKMSRSVSWVTGLLFMACSGSYVKDVGDLNGGAGEGSSESSGGSQSTAGTGGNVVVSPGGQGGGTVVAEAGQGGQGGTVENPSCPGCWVDTLGPAESTPFLDKHSTVSANVIDVKYPRILGEIQATLKITKRTSAAWVVYEELETGYELRLDVPTKLEPGDGSYSSGSIAYELMPGHRYAIGVYLNVGACYMSDAPDTNELTFGTVAGASLNGGGDYHAINEIIPGYGEQFAMRLYTFAGDQPPPFECPTDPASLQALAGQSCEAEGFACVDPGPLCAHNYSVDCEDGVWTRRVGLPAPCPPSGEGGAGGAP